MAERDSLLAYPVVEAVCATAMSRQGGAASWWWAVGWLVQIGELHGHVSDLQALWTEGAVQQITNENTTLKQRVRRLATDNRTLHERLKAARSNS
ncbi:hypothetical protein [Streptomyces guryensis]|uniref:Uncharacterized protein n=1 Tax=Streptomyces guryensis TaxID=2886947 RepID=A0A9Q3VNE6_9ACTN|nr:hypothetical protein [Streptomyces guryensis]MCD9875739.1 hypothetical protein [Streptomyces guryensis]